MCKRPNSAMHYYLEFVEGMWVAENHWGEVIAKELTKEDVRKSAESIGYIRF